MVVRRDENVRPNRRSAPLNQEGEMSPPAKILADGVDILRAILESHEFEYVRGLESAGSGGRFARGSFVREDRHLEFSVRRALGLVRYHVGSVSLSHDEYVRAVSGFSGEYPGYSAEPLDGFRHLLSDLREHGDIFLSGSTDEFERLVPDAGNRGK